MLTWQPAGGTMAEASSVPRVSRSTLCEEGSDEQRGCRISREALLPFVGEGSVLAPVVLELVEKGFLYCPSDGFEEEEEELEA